jgi:hypothetical protein
MCMCQFCPIISYVRIDHLIVFVLLAFAAYIAPGAWTALYRTMCLSEDEPDLAALFSDDGFEFTPPHGSSPGSTPSPSSKKSS